MLALEEVWQSNRNMRRVAQGEDEIDLTTRYQTNWPAWLAFDELPTIEKFMEDPLGWRDAMPWINWDLFVGFIPRTTMLFEMPDGACVMAILLGDYILFQHCAYGDEWTYIDGIKPPDPEALFERIHLLWADLLSLMGGSLSDTQ